MKQGYNTTFRVRRSDGARSRSRRASLVDFLDDFGYQEYLELYD